MDINVTAEGVPILRLKAIEPEDAADDGITLRRVHGQDFSCEAPRFEDRAGRSTRPDFFRILRSPTGVALLLSASPRPNLEVETGYWAILMLSRSTNIS